MSAARLRLSHCLRSRHAVGPAAVLLVAFLSAQPCGAGNFVASLQSNYVVTLDFGADTTGASSSAPPASDSSTCPSEGCANPEAVSERATDVDESDTKIMAFAGGKRKFKCRLPSVGGDRSKKGSGLTEEERTKLETHFRNAKLAPMKGKCGTRKRDFWTYDVCFGRKITQHNKEAGLTYSLGKHVPTKDKLLPNGEVRQMYLHGTDNRSSEVAMVCGSSALAENRLSIEETEAKKYFITWKAPQFCSWKGDGTSEMDKDGKILLRPSSLLEELRGECINTTLGWWTYEYCFPDKLVQYHLQNKVRDPIHLLGALDAQRESVDKDTVNMSIVRLKAGGGSTLDRRAVPSAQRVLQQYVGGGAVCDETKRARSALVQFSCPSGWESLTDSKFVGIQESQLCQYEVTIHTNLLCGHRRLTPTPPRGKQEIKCSAEPSEDDV
eukprot:TRINITY_DN55749_c0_g1_i1.p1 TRINITY_DN55749_c0_g1~~TRINITY_DN55749_c0_g1_i1.p1  ORF type:complete len:463 (+),score=93.04 TRINITY_DN55749_c0_g1_i1:73-1389(+)